MDSMASEGMSDFLRECVEDLREALAARHAGYLAGVKAAQYGVARIVSADELVFPAITRHEYGRQADAAVGLRALPEKVVADRVVPAFPASCYAVLKG